MAKHYNIIGLPAQSPSWLLFYWCTFLPIWWVKIAFYYDSFIL